MATQQRSGLYISPYGTAWRTYGGLSQLCTHTSWGRHGVQECTALYRPQDQAGGYSLLRRQSRPNPERYVAQFSAAEASHEHRVAPSALEPSGPGASERSTGKTIRQISSAKRTRWRTSISPHGCPSRPTRAPASQVAGRVQHEGERQEHGARHRPNDVGVTMFKGTKVCRWLLVQLLLVGQLERRAARRRRNGREQGRLRIVPSENCPGRRTRGTSEIGAPRGMSDCDWNVRTGSLSEVGLVRPEARGHRYLLYLSKLT